MSTDESSPAKPTPDAPAQPAPKAAHPKPPFEITVQLHSKDAALEQVQKSLDGEKAARREERFYWICAVFLIFDMFMFKDTQTWTAPVVVGILQLAVLIPLGRWLGVDEIWTVTERLIEKWDGKIPKSGGD